MSEEYLWDRTGPTDAEVEQLERLLGQFGTTSTNPPAWLTEAPGLERSWPSWRYLSAAAALIVACASGLWTVARAPRPAWSVVRVAGAPTLAEGRIDETGRLQVGEWLETDAHSRATVHVSTIGLLDVDPNSRLQLLGSTDGSHRLSLNRGTVHALIWAPPGQFVVETPSSTAVDLGCAYTLQVGDDGAGMIEVTAGWVGFEHAGREAFIPAGAHCATRPGIGPGTPYFDDAPETLVRALGVIDFGEPSSRRDAVSGVLSTARSRDAVTLWHLLSRLPADDRGRVFDALARMTPPPASVTRDGIARGDRAMLDAWWDELGLGTTSWWRLWKRNWSDR
jgi:hypothetical protein